MNHALTQMQYRFAVTYETPSNSLLDIGERKTNAYHRDDNMFYRGLLTTLIPLYDIFFHF